MPLDRVDARLETVWQHRVGLVVAPAGSGKSTLLSRFALRHSGPVGWYRAEGWDRDEPALLAHVEAALAPALNGTPRDWQTVADAANALETWHGEPILLVIDDLHTLQETPAEAALERLIEYAPQQLTILIASRVPPLFNLPRMRVSGELLELTGEDLRFRSWEVERLFHDFYAEPLMPEELARLARRTEGWAAGLQLFHLATRGRTPDERRRVLGELGDSFAIHARLPDAQRAPPTAGGPAPISAGLVRAGPIERAGVRRLAGPHRQWRHPVRPRKPSPVHATAARGRPLSLPRGASLISACGAARGGRRRRTCISRFRAAAAVLLQAGAVPEALEAYCHAEDWESASRLLASQGASLPMVHSLG